MSKIQEERDAQRIQKERERMEKRKEYKEELITLPAVCVNCKFFEIIDGHNGNCRKYAPSPMLFDLSKSDGGEIFPVFPSVGIDEWCGEFQFDPQILKNALRVEENGVIYIGGKNG